MSVFVIVRSFTITDFTLNFVFHKLIDYLTDLFFTYLSYICYMENSDKNEIGKKYQYFGIRSYLPPKDSLLEYSIYYYII